MFAASVIPVPASGSIQVSEKALENEKPIIRYTHTWLLYVSQWTLKHTAFQDVLVAQARRKRLMALEFVALALCLDMPWRLGCLAAIKGCSNDDPLLGSISSAMLFETLQSIRKRLIAMGYRRNAERPLGRRHRHIDRLGEVVR
jgi:hypothetical protein